MSNGQGCDHVRYVIVVHGIGKQRKNETVLEVINRFAEVRAGARTKQKGDPLTLGMLSGQTADINQRTGKPNPWIEFEGIPCSPTAKPVGPFLGRPATNNDGDNIRFVDVHWADIMRDQYEEVGEDVAVWSSSLIERLRQNPKRPRWALDLLTALRESILLVQYVMRLKFPILAIEIFNEFLGDVQLYGEYGPCRGQGVRIFHDLMAEVQAAHNLEQEERKNHKKPVKEARYTIIAHSLGSIMSLDALLYACANRNSGPGVHPHFQGYLRNNERQDPLDSTKRWIGNVDALVTLGSPIDKYLVVWWLNYEYLAKPAWLVMPQRNGQNHNILHFNYSDEQDPVGGELDIAYTKPAVKTLFEESENLVFTRYPIPAVAHNDYWKDLNLFNEIVHRAVDNATQTTQRLKTLKPFVLRAYLCALGINYFLIPAVFWLVLGFSVTLGAYTDSWHIRIMSLFLFGGTLYVGRRVFHFIIEGRQVVLSKLKDCSYARTAATALLPVIYFLFLLSAAWAGRSLWPFAEDFLSCLPEQGWDHCGELSDLATVPLSLWGISLGEIPGLTLFLWDILGLVVVAYGLCVYLFYKLRRLAG